MLDLSALRAIEPSKAQPSAHPVPSSQSSDPVRITASDANAILRGFAQLDAMRAMQRQQRLASYQASLPAGIPRKYRTSAALHYANTEYHHTFELSEPLHAKVYHASMWQIQRLRLRTIRHPYFNTTFTDTRAEVRYKREVFEVFDFTPEALRYYQREVYPFRAERDHLARRLQAKVLFAIRRARQAAHEAKEVSPA